MIYGSSILDKAVAQRVGQDAKPVSDVSDMSSAQTNTGQG